MCFVFYLVFCYDFFICCMCGSFTQFILRTENPSFTPRNKEINREIKKMHHLVKIWKLMSIDTGCRGVDTN